MEEYQNNALQCKSVKTSGESGEISKIQLWMSVIYR